MQKNDDPRDVTKFPKTRKKGKSILIEVGDGLYIQVNYFEYKMRYSYTVYSAVREDPDKWMHNITVYTRESYDSEEIFLKYFYNMIPVWLTYETIMFPFGPHVLSREEVYEERDKQNSKQ